AEYASLREQYAAKTRDKKLITLEEARANRTPIEWKTYEPPKPDFIGARVASPSIVDLARFIDWSPFFHTWELRGRYPAIFEDPAIGKQARELFDDSQKILDEIAAKDLFTARGIFGFWPANSTGDDVDLFRDESRHEKLATF